MTRFKLAKLVRDKIVDKQIAADTTPHYKILNKEEHIAALVIKLSEEAKEILSSKEEDRPAEIADVQQVLADLKLVLGITDEQVLKAQKAKLISSGGFSKGIYVEYLDVDKNNEWYNYYKKDPDKYPEIGT